MSDHDHSRSSFYTGGAASHACPACGKHGLVRIRRRFIDRLLSLFVSRHRFRCTHSGCAWEGSLRARRPLRRLLGPDPSGSGGDTP